MPEITLNLTADEAKLVRLALRQWDGWTPDGTISDDEFSTLIAVSRRLDTRSQERRVVVV